MGISHPCNTTEGEYGVEKNDSHRTIIRRLQQIGRLTIPMECQTG